MASAIRIARRPIRDALLALEPDYHQLFSLDILGPRRVHVLTIVDIVPVPRERVDPSKCVDCFNGILGALV